MIEEPKMPEDWWPDDIFVKAKHGNIELAFNVVSNVDRSLFTQAMQGLREAIWQATNDPAFLERSK